MRHVRGARGKIGECGANDTESTTAAATSMLSPDGTRTRARRVGAPVQQPRSQGAHNEVCTY
jgi:hypothetical protein